MSQSRPMAIDPVGPDHRAFEALQKKLVPLWEYIGAGPGGPIQADNTTVVVSSMSLDFDVPAALLHTYEERMLFLLFLLQQPHIRLVYVTSEPISETIVSYYLGLLPGVAYSNARKRLSLVTVADSSAEPLSKKLLDRPQLLGHIRSLIPDLDRAHLVPFTTTHLEQGVALALGIPMYGADPAYFDFGTKSGGRRLFREEEIPHPVGYNDLSSEEELISAIQKMRAERPHLPTVIVKLNEGSTGEGNAMLDLRGLPMPGEPTERKAIAEALPQMQFEFASSGYDAYRSALEQKGGIVEELIAGSEVRSPSAQLRITPSGEVEMLSTHDQILGGPTGQSFLGARFPADRAYAWTIMEQAYMIGRRLADEGVLGRFAVDFVVVQAEDGRWSSYAIEINLRKGGTTAPYLTLEYLTDGHYRPEEGRFTTVRGDEKCYVASDHIESPHYRVFTPELLFDIVSRHQLHYCHATQSGVVLHLLSDVGGSGQVGATAIANSHDEADALYQYLLEVLDREAEHLSR